MPENVSNNTANVSVGEGVRGGYLYSAPLTAKLPTDVETPLKKVDPSYQNLGFVTSDGLVLTDETESTTFTDLNGDTIATADTSETHTWGFTLAEAKASALAEQYGQKNVEDKDGLISIHGRSGGFEERRYIAELILRDERRARFILPRAIHQSTGEQTINKENIFGRQVTILGMPDESGDTYIYYIESTETMNYKPSVLTEGDLLGKDAAAFGTFSIDGDKVSGEANKITGFEAYSDNPDEQEGYYVPLTFPNWEGVEIVNSRLPERRTELKGDGNVLVFLGKDSITPGITLSAYWPESDVRTITFDGVTAKEA